MRIWCGCLSLADGGCVKAAHLGLKVLGIGGEMGTKKGGGPEKGAELAGCGSRGSSLMVAASVDGW